MISKSCNKYALLVILVFCISIISAFALADLDKAEKVEGFDQFTEDFEVELNSFEGQKLPNVLSPFIKDESLVIEITLDSEEILNYHIIVDSGVISTAGVGDLEEFGYKIVVSQEFIEEHAGEAFGKSLRDGLTTGEVKHVANGFWKKIKFSMMLAAVDIAALFEE
jgi:hypothetical protein